MVIRIRHPSADDCMRCLELLQRSNQFNLSGRRYSEQEFDDLLRSTWHDCYCFEVSDDFGSYGIVGFAAFLLSEAAPLLVDFVLSCRVAQKLVEATFFSWYAERQQRHGQTTLRAELLPTPRNAPLQEVLRQFGFSSVAGRQGRQDRQLLEFSMDGPLQQPEVMIVDDSRVWDSATRLYVDDSDIPAVSNDASDRQSWWSEAGHRGAA